MVLDRDQAAGSVLVARVGPAMGRAGVNLADLGRDGRAADFRENDVRRGHCGILHKSQVKCKGIIAPNARDIAPRFGTFQAMDINQISAALQRMGKTQAELADYMGWSESTASRLLNGKRQLKAREIHKIRLFFGDAEFSAIAPDIAQDESREAALLRRGIEIALEVQGVVRGTPEWHIALGNALQRGLDEMKGRPLSA
jgi:transcriptional regulator with XRE-family HTH domain